MDTRIDSADFIERVEGILYSAIDLKPGDERERFLESACAGDSRLRAAIEIKIAEQANVEEFFGNDAVLSCAGEISRTIVEREMARGDTTIIPGEESSKKIGAYTLRRKLGEGGCGSVYMAEQESPVRREVAFKIIKLGMDTKQVIARFEAERQALALMEHPNIAHVLDAGATETGRPYFVMELIRGIKITEYCDHHRLAIRQRLDLFVQVCHAIQHAHQKGIIHRDIKPSNVLVTDHDGRVLPKVIDFGIAKATGEELLAAGTALTRHGHFMGTPTYMSPEQATGGIDVDTRSDIYSLGILLYELLTGVTPLDQKELLEAGFDEMRRILREREPQRPSALLGEMPSADAARSAGQRRTDPHRLKALIKGDLDWITMKAIEKDRTLRYHSVSGLVADIERHCANEPVVARPPSQMYRFQKLVRRNRAIFAAIAAASTALIVGLGLATWFWRQERQARQRAVAAEMETSRLLQQAKDGERMAEAKFLLVQGKFEEADALVSEVSVVTSSLEAESVLRDLGKWHTLRGEWAQAAALFERLLETDQKDRSSEFTGDLLMAALIQIELGNLEGYERFRHLAVMRVLDTTDPILAERTIKISLLLPADAELMNSLERLSKVVANSVRGIDVPPTIVVAWRYISLALMAYRQGDFPAAKTWCRTCLAFPDIPSNESRTAIARIIQAMASYRAGEIDVAREDLTMGRNCVEDGFVKVLKMPGNFGWNDWLFARILLREADALIKSGSK